MSIPRFAGWGAMGGGLLSLLFLVTALVAVGPQQLALAAVFVAFMTLLGTGSAAGSLALARRTDDGVGEAGSVCEGAESHPAIAPPHHCR